MVASSQPALSEDAILLIARLENLRERLLDLTKRNKLLSTKFSDRNTSHFRIIDEVPDILYDKLTNSDMEFAALPPVDDETKDEDVSEFKSALNEARLTDAFYQTDILNIEQLEAEKSGEAVEKAERDLRNRLREQLGMQPLAGKAKLSITDHAESFGFNTSFDLSENTDTENQRHHDDIIQTLMLPETYQRRLAKVLDHANGYRQETGLNTLFMAFGFLEWVEPNKESNKLYAPLLLLPATMSRKVSNSQYIYSIKADDETAQFNVSLKELLKREFKLELPEFIEGMTPSVYWQEIREKILVHKPTWKIRTWVAIGVFPFAKLAMYEDIAPTSLNIMKNKLVHEILWGVDSKNDLNSEIQIHDIDELELSNSAPPVIMDADSSQHSAIIDALSGKSLVIKGPPGTGKSQTISNIIAAAFAKNQTVLFVAEKLAALEVVHKRLTSAGFGHFCMPLHSEQANRKNVLESLRKRLDQKRLPEPQEYESTLRQLNQKRKMLNDYVNQMNTGYGTSNSTVHDIFWKTRAIDNRLPHIPELEKFAIKNPQKFTEEDLKNAEHLLDDAQAIYQKFLSSLNGRDFNAWENIDLSDSNPFKLKRLITLLKDFAAISQEIINDSKIIEAALNNSQIAAWSDLYKIKHDIQSTLDAMQIVDWPLLQKIIKTFGLAPATQLSDHMLETVKTGEQLTTWINDLNRIELEKIRVAAELARFVPSNGIQIRDIEILAGEYENRIAKAIEIEAVVGRINNIVELPRALTLAHWRKICEFATLTRPHSADTLHYRTASMADPIIIERIKSECVKATELVQKVSTAAAKFDLAKTKAANLTDIILLLQKPFLSGFLGSAISKSRKVYNSILREIKNPKIGKQEMLADFLFLQQLLNEVLNFERNSQLQLFMGPKFDGLNTKFDNIFQAANYIEQVNIKFIGTGLDQTLRGFALSAFADAILAVINSITDDLHIEPTFTNDMDELDKFISSGKEIIINLRKLNQIITEIGVLSPATPVAHLGNLAKDLERYLESSARVEGLAAEFGIKKWSSLVELSEYLKIYRAALSKAIQISHYPSPIQSLAIQNHEFVHDIDRLVSALNNKFKSAQEILQDLALEVNDKTIFASDLKDQSLADLNAKCENLVSQEHCLEFWIEVCHVRRLLEDAGLIKFFDKAIKANINNIRLYDLFLQKVRHAQMEDIYNMYPAIAKGNGRTLEAARNDFQGLDKEIQKLTREKIASDLLKRRPNAGNSAGKVSSYTDMSLINHELSKQKKHIAVRDLLSRAKDAVLTLKPCFMMSPLAVAQFLRKSHFSFDLLIIDEASQMRPEDAIGAFARAKRVITVGDPKQLPPSTFFERMMENSEDNAEEDENILNESILDRAIAVYGTPRELNWHYRSQTSNLISFSNQKFYENRLVVFPGAQDKTPLKGIVHKYCANGLYRISTNAEEAAEVVRAAIRFMNERPNESLGIVAINQPQRELIKSELDRAVAEDTNAAEYVQRWEEHLGGLEYFFVKNLENVQGDERDVIFISTVYGPAVPNGPVAQQFGPVNSPAGARRLNVLFTRAKNQLVLFTSMRPGDILGENARHEGVQVLRDYLEYAATGRIETGRNTGSAPDSPFEEMVIEQIEAMGFEAVPQVGVGKFKIDIGVRHPKLRYGYLLGIECDGAAYHSSACARDRDRLRQEILESRGWKLYRIWSTDWFKDPIGETERLRQAMLKAYEANCAFIEEVESAKSIVEIY